MRGVSAGFQKGNWMHGSMLSLCIMDTCIVGVVSSVVGTIDYLHTTFGQQFIVGLHADLIRVFVNRR